MKFLTYDEVYRPDYCIAQCPNCGRAVYEVELILSETRIVVCCLSCFKDFVGERIDSPAKEVRI